MQGMWGGILKSETLSRKRFLQSWSSGWVCQIMIIFHCCQLLVLSWTFSCSLAFSLCFLWILSGWIKRSSTHKNNATIEEFSPATSLMELRVLDNQVLDWGPLELPLKSCFGLRKKSKLGDKGTFGTWVTVNWCVRSWFLHSVSTSASLVWASSNSSSLSTNNCSWHRSRPIILIHLILSTAPFIGPASPWPCWASPSPFPLSVSSLPCGNTQSKCEHGTWVKWFLGDLENLSDVLIIWNDGIFGPQFSFHPIKLSFQHQLELFSFLRERMH